MRSGPLDRARAPAAGRRALAGTALVGLIATITLAACNLGDDFAEDLVEKAAKRNEDRRIEQQREELPLPDPDVVPYKSVPPEEMAVRDEFQVDLVDDLVLGEGRTGPDYLFVTFAGNSSALGNVAVDGEGRIYVLETRSDEVRVFDPGGRFLFKFGRPGEGPGDFQRPFGVVVAGGQVRVFHRSLFTSVWSLDGSYLDDQQAVPADEADSSEDTRVARRFRVPVRVIGRPDGSMIMITRATNEEQTGRIPTPVVRVVGRFEEGREVQRYMEIPEWAQPSVAVAANGEMYIGMFGHLRSEHYIVALDAAGEPRWTLVTPWNPGRPPRADLRVDGQGRLYVFPNFRVYYVQPPEGEEEGGRDAGTASGRGGSGRAATEAVEVAVPEDDPGYVLAADDPRRPVQVYSRDGEIIGSGYLNRRPVFLNWQVTAGDRIYGVRVDPTDEEWEVVRYRIRIGGG